MFEFLISLMFKHKKEEMYNKLKEEILPKGSLSKLAISQGYTSWENLFLAVKKLPYGRNADRKDFSLVLKEGQGSCSSKHAFLKQIADENERSDVKLILVMYAMSRDNTPGIGETLVNFPMDYIPEAHCYLNFDSIKYDLTSVDSSIEHLAPYILFDEEIEANQVVDYKVNLHQEFLKSWLIEQGLSISFEELWSMREKCITQLSVKVGS